MLAKKRPVIALDIKLKHYFDPEFLGTGLEATAYADDGVVEAIEATDDRFVLGVQWHPERIRDREHSRKVFGAFIEAAREYRENKTCP